MTKRLFYDKEGAPVEVDQVKGPTSLWVHFIWAVAVVAIVRILLVGRC